MSFGPEPAFGQQRSGKLEQLLGQKDIIWKEYGSRHFRIFFEQGSFAQGRADSVQQELARCRTELLAFFGGGDSSAVGADVVVYSSEEHIKRGLGFVAQGFAIPEHKVVVFLHNQRFRLAARHELAHYYAFHLWGKEADNGFSEGIAVFLDKTWNSRPIDQLSKHLKNEKRLIKMPNLMKDFFKFDAMIAYPQIGSFTGFLLGQYGKEKLHQIWQRGFKDAKTVYGSDLGGLEKQWLLWLDQFDASGIDYARHLKAKMQ